MASRNRKDVAPGGPRPVPWTVPTLVAKPAPPPLEMRLDLVEAERERRERQQKEETSSVFSPEPGTVFIPAGEFRMGADDSGAPDESPMHTLLLNSYWIDKYPVTNLDYKAFVDATGHQPPPHWRDGDYLPDQADHPVVNVSWHDADAFARWVNKRLPTEAEWEKAARGIKGQVYPWGDAFRKDSLNCQSENGGTRSVKAFPNGVSPYGVMDMCGNACEWVEDWYFDEYYRTSPLAAPAGPPGGQYKVIRGGFFGENKEGVRCSSRHYAPPDAVQEHVGFRCAKTPVLPGQKTADLRPGPGTVPEERRLPPEPAGAEPTSPEEAVERIAARRPEQAARAVRTLLLEEARPGGKGEADPTGRGKVALLMIALGQDTAAEILKYLNDYEIEDIAQGIAGLKTVTAEEKHEALKAFKLLLAGDFTLSGGVDFARGALEKAVGPRRGQQMLDRVSATTSGGFYLLRSIAPNQISPFIGKEHPQTIALILAQLDPSQAAGVLNFLPGDLQADVIYRMTTLEDISPQVLREIEESLAAELQAVLKGQVAEIGGPKRVAEIINLSFRSTEKAVLERLDAQDPEIAEEIRNRMFTFDDISTLTDREIEALLQETDPHDLAVAIQGAAPQLVERIQINLSSDQHERINREIQQLDEMLATDVEQVQLRIVQIVRRLEEEGKIRVVRGNEVKVVVKQQRRLEDLIRERTRELEETHGKLQETQERLIEELEKELQTAHEMQMGLMPTEHPQIEGLDVAGRCVPANHVGGDYFQYFIQNNRLAICMADVTGHAMEAAIPGVMFSGILKSHMELGGTLRERFNRLNRSLYGTLKRRTLICFVMGELDLSTRAYSLSDSGCPYPYHFRASTGELVELQVDNYPMGVRPNTEYQVVETQLIPGDCVVLCSDGIIEAPNQAGDQFGYDRTSEVIRRACEENRSAAELIDQLMETVNAFRGSAPQADDMTCVVLQVKEG